MLQKIIKVGNSAAVTIPKQFLNQVKLQPGDQVVVEPDSEKQLLLISTPRKDSSRQSTITPEFLDWLSEFNKQYGPALKDLAQK